MRSAADTATALSDAVLAGDHPAIVALLAPDVVLRSPIVRFPFEGRDDVADVYRAVLDGFDAFELVEVAGGPDGLQVLRFKATVLGRTGETISLLHVNPDGLIGEVVIYVRPLSTAAAVGAVMGPPLARRNGRLQWLAAMLLSRWLPRFIELADPLLPRLVTRRR
jgi:hypothetical protein